jgi:maltooligosyltrehalose synthase
VISPSPVSLSATYRLQLHVGFGFAEATALIPYLKALGISHLHCSPILQAALACSHGYDVVDHARISDALGGRAGFQRMADAAHGAGMGVIVDIVPNRMSIADPSNAWWCDVLENGPSAQAAHLFDVDWDPPEPKLKSVILLPVLGDHRHRRGSTYVPLAIAGDTNQSVIAFLRSAPDAGTSIVVTRRLFRTNAPPAALSLMLPTGEFRDELSFGARSFSGRAKVSELLIELPVALLPAEPRP